jgi:AraC-like DNA-binding protein
MTNSLTSPISFAPNGGFARQTPRTPHSSQAQSRVASMEATLNKPFSLPQENPITPTERASQVCAIETADEPVTALPPVDSVPDTLQERLVVARERLRLAAEHGLRIRVYEVALDLDMSEFHFARQFRSAFGCSPHVYYDEVRAARARDLLRQGTSQGQAARKIGLRRPAELRALLAKRQSLTGMADVAEYCFLAAGAN